MSDLIQFYFILFLCIINLMVIAIRRHITILKSWNVLIKIINNLEKNMCNSKRE